METWREVREVMLRGAIVDGVKRIIGRQIYPRWLRKIG